VLANPKVLVLNKQQGEVHVGKNIGYKTAVTTDTLTASSVSFLDTGIRLLFRPYVGEDGFIRMEIHPEDSDGSIDANGNPQKTTTEITSNIMVRDGRTIVIGGLFQDSTTRTRSQVPFLGNLPGVGALFRQQADATARQEIIILLTPHIIKDYDAYASASEDEARAGDRLEVGARHGLMPWGRERLAESWYEMAVTEMAKPHPDRKVALWHLDCAIHLNPMFTEALDLRAQVTGKEMTATDNSTIRSFVRKQIMTDKANPKNEDPRPAVTPIDPTPATQAGRDAAKPSNTSAKAKGPTPTTKPAVAKVELPATEPSSVATVDDSDHGQD
jgi:type IV pilus assembly protein PilQ